MTSSPQKRSRTKQAGPKGRKRARTESDSSRNLRDDRTENVPARGSSSRKRGSESKTAAKNRRTRRRKHDLAVMIPTANTQPNDEPGTTSPKSPENPVRSLTTGSKRPSPTDAADTSDPITKVDTRAIYDANKEEIIAWYDLDYSIKRGVKEGHPLLHSDEPWYYKLFAWQKHRGHIKSPKKKRKLNNGHAQIVDTVDEPPKRHQVRYASDIVSVPEYPFDSLDDFETMPNGNYRCSHIKRTPPGQCCIVGLSRHAKYEAIKKSKDVWKKQVERLIDKKQLDPKHKTWANWVDMRLRKKFQPKFFREQEEKKREKAKEKREEQKRTREDIEETDVEPRSPKQQPVERSAMPSQMHTHAAPINTSRRPASLRRPQPTLAFQTLGIDVGKPAVPTPSAARPVNMYLQETQEEPDPYSASYDEDPQETSDFVQFQEQGVRHLSHQQLEKEQRPIVENKSPSYSAGFALLSEVSPFSRTVQEPTQTLELIADSNVRALHEPDLTLSSIAETPNLRNSSMAADSQCLPGAVHASETHMEPFELMDFETLDTELDRILTTCAVTQVFFLSLLPQSFSSGSDIVDEEMVELLRQAYRIELTPRGKPEDEQSLRMMLEQSQADWRRYCNLHAAEDIVIV